MVIHSLYIINKAGGLIYQTDFTPGLNKLTANEYLVLAGTIHGVFAIASKLTPTALKLSTPSSLSSQSSSLSQTSSHGSKNSGLRCIETDKFSIFIYQTLTGVKFMLITSGPTSKDINDLNYSSDVAEGLLKNIYAIYSDYVMKNPFYSLDMPIRVDLFDTKVRELVKGTA
ncbi:hypothetical protein WICMUC_003989 [Wickerhamomyces mucosus]|uniref:Trafficking protein particle complex subunit n=1 Tax=Wickerhamomyces mucosus TaxID=1378264 RepID=A0A9P8PIV5_9ASCO|nr:hypothetical protein WICMUC_003989 [Wickerhamomyces mucosus]